MIIRYLTDDGEDHEIEVDRDVTELFVYTDTLVALGKVDLR